MAMISQEKINEIKVNNDIVDVISSYISVNEKYQAICPFHSDHSPSLSIHPEKQIYKCWACGESGNVITFVEKFNGISFVEALKLLADRAGIQLDISTPKKSTANDKYYEINDTVLKFYKNNLISTEGKEAMKYLRENDTATIKFYEGNAFIVEAPNFVDLKIIETEPGVKGNTATNVTKAATVETGAVIQVPIFIEEGEVIQIDTRTGEYLSRA